MPIVASRQQVNGRDSVILVEVDGIPDEARGGWDADWRDTREGRAERVMDAARDVFGDGLALARDCAVRTVEALGQTAAEVRPDEFELQLAIKLDAEAGAIITKIGAGAQLQVNMRWSRNP